MFLDLALKQGTWSECLVFTTIYSLFIQESLGVGVWVGVEDKGPRLWVH